MMDVAQTCFLLINMTPPPFHCGDDIISAGFILASAHYRIQHTFVTLTLLTISKVRN